MSEETWVFQAYRGSSTPRFATAEERDIARLLDHYGIGWEYEPTTFPLARDGSGRTLEAFTPDFHLPDQQLYLELTSTRPALIARKRRKLRLLRETHPGVQVLLFERRDLDQLARRARLRAAS